MINGAHGAGKTQLLMQSRVALERSMDACKVGLGLGLGLERSLPRAR